MGLSTNRRQDVGHSGPTVNSSCLASRQTSRLTIAHERGRANRVTKDDSQNDCVLDHVCLREICTGLCCSPVAFLARTFCHKTRSRLKLAAVSVESSSVRSCELPNWSDATHYSSDD